MRRRILALALGAIATTSIFAATAAGSGPAAPGKETIKINCGGLGTVTISVPRPEKSRGAGQIVGQKGHGIPTVTSFTVTDVTKGKVLFSESRPGGGGHAHPNQPTTQCNATVFEGLASVFFEGHEPTGVAPSDLIRASAEAQVIIKR